MSSPGSSQGTSGPPQMPPGPPYAPQVAQVGGIPTENVDVPVSATLLFFFIISAYINMFIFQTNNHRKNPGPHKFIPSVILFGFSMARIAALTLRIVWSKNQTNVSVAIAASVLVAAGVVLLFILNLLFTQRILRAYHPGVGWHKAIRACFTFLYICVGALLIMVITVTVYSFYTIDAAARQQCRTVQLVAGTFLALLAFVPIPVVATTLLWPRKEDHALDKFGSGSMRTKVRLVVFTASLLTLGAGFRIGTAFMPPRPIGDPAWYHSKPAFYCFNFVIELVVVYSYALTRFDRRFHVPDGSSEPGHYSGRVLVPPPAPRKQKGGEKAAMMAESGRSSMEVKQMEKGQAGQFGDTPNAVDGQPPVPAELRNFQRRWEVDMKEQPSDDSKGVAL